MLEPVRAAHQVEVAEIEERALSSTASAVPGASSRPATAARSGGPAPTSCGPAWPPSPPHYRDRLAAGVTGAEATRCLDAIAAIDAANEALIRNPNEVLWLQALLLRLS